MTRSGRKAFRMIYGEHGVTVISITMDAEQGLTSSCDGNGVNDPTTQCLKPFLRYLFAFADLAFC